MGGLGSEVSHVPKSEAVKCTHLLRFEHFSWCLGHRRRGPTYHKAFSFAGGYLILCVRCLVNSAQNGVNKFSSVEFRKRLEIWVLKIPIAKMCSATVFFVPVIRFERKRESRIA